MRVKVADNVRGELVVPAMKAAYAPGTTILMNEEQFWAESTQWALERGFIVPLEDYEQKNNDQNGVSLRSLAPNPLNILVLKRPVRYNEVFFVSNEQLEDKQIRDAITAGIFVREGRAKQTVTPGGTVVKTQQKVSTKKEPVKAEISKEKPKTIKPVSKSVSSHSNVKAVIRASDEEISPPSDGVELPKLKSNKREAYVHRPDGARINEPPKTVQPKSNPLILDVTGNNEEVE